MVDLHIHILPGIDDGAKSLKESVEMARMSAAGGVRAVSATSHGDFSFYEPEEYLENYGKKLEDFCRALKEEQIPLEVHRGMELMVNESLLKAGQKGPLPGYGGSRRLLVEFFRLGLFEDPYVDASAADAKVNTEESRTLAYKAHQESVVLLKNHDSVLPLTAEKLAGKKVYVEMMMRTEYTKEEKENLPMTGIEITPEQTIAAFAKAVRRDHPDWTFVDDYHDADVALLLLKPTSGSYFAATEGYLELNLCKETGIDVDHIRAIREAVPQVVVHVNLNLPYLLGNVEPLADAVTVGFDTFSKAAIDVISGAAEPVGRLPITLPGSDAAIAVDDNGVCASPNDVPGYDKAKYMKDGLTYAYKDADGSEYLYGFGLTYET